jgi:hypothetical protein
MHNGYWMHPDEEDVDELSFDEDPVDSASEIGDYGDELDDELIEHDNSRSEPAHHHRQQAAAPAILVIETSPEFDVVEEIIVFVEEPMAPKAPAKKAAAKKPVAKKAAPPPPPAKKAVAKKVAAKQAVAKKVAAKKEKTMAGGKGKPAAKGKKK